MDQSLDKLIDDFVKLWSRDGLTNDLTPAQFAWYESALSDLPREDVVAAMQAALLKSKWLPKPAELRELAGAKPEQFDPAGLAWKVVREAIRKIGGYESVMFHDAAIGVAIDDLGGWAYLCGLTNRDLDFKAKDFPKVYELACRMPNRKLRVLAGIFAQEGGLPADRVQTKLIGFVDGEIRIAEHRTPEQQQTLLDFAKPVVAERLVKTLEKNSCEPEVCESSPAKLISMKSPEIVQAEMELNRSRALQALKKQVFGNSRRA